MFTVVGKTTDGKLVLANVYKYYSSIGLPLDTLFDNLSQKGYMPSWIHFVREAIAAGMKKSRVLSMLEDPLMDIYGVEFKNHVIERLKGL